MNDKNIFFFFFLFFFFLISSLTVRRDPLHTTVKKNIRAKGECVGWEDFVETKKSIKQKKSGREKTKKQTSNQSVNR